MYWIATIWGIHQISPFSLVGSLMWAAASFLSLMLSEIDFFLSQLLKLTVFGTVPRWSQINIFYEMVQTSTLQCAAPVMSRALFCLSVLVHHKFLHFLHLLVFMSHDYLSTHSIICCLFLCMTPLEPVQIDVLILTSTFSETKMINSRATNVSPWMYNHYHIPIVPTAAQSPIEHVPSADGYNHLQNHQKGACWFVHESCILPAITVCCKMTELPRKGTKSWAEETQK